MRVPGKWQQRVQTLFSLERRHAIPLCAALFVAIVIADLATPPQLNLTFAYVFVILLVCWNIGTAAALGTAALASGMEVWILSELDTVERFSVFWFVVLGNRVFTFFLVVALTAPLRSLYRDEHATARSDSLTGAANRRQFLEILAVEIARSGRARNPFSLAYVDFDNFKKINDTRGHGEGDALLRTAVEAMRQTLRLVDSVARIGGDEFVVLLPSTGANEAAATVERLRADLGRAMSANSWEVTVSIGLGTFEGRGLNPEEVVANCDRLMYRAKSGGKDRIASDLFLAS
jgi:diguanylate cyclase (GGDEF)-like protein